MDFSFVLKINEEEYHRFGNAKIRQDADGYGVYGVCTSEFTVDIPADDYTYGNIPPAAPVRLYFDGNSVISPPFYISTRSRCGGIVSFKCYDRMIRTDQTIILDDGYFTNGVIESQQLVGIISHQCGFAAFGIGKEAIALPTVNISREYAEGKSCRDILEAISSAWCGYFRVSLDERLIFIPFGIVYDKVISNSHAAIVEGGSKGPVDLVIMTNGTDTFSSGYGSGEVFSTLKLTSDFASQSIADQIFNRVKGYTYQAWQCSKCFIQYGSGDTEIDAEITFADGSVRVANSITKVPAASGIVVTCGRNDVTENEFDYTGALSRQIKKRIADGEILGNNTMITRYQGIIHLGEKKTDDNGNVTQDRYGYSSANANGVVKYDGAIVDKTLPDEISVNENADGFSVNYGGTKINYKLNWDGDNIVGMEEYE